jgi:ankyrin repeat protein
MSITPGSTKKKNTKTKDIETFPAPALEIELHPNILLNASLENDYQTICGALDFKDHPLSAYLINENLFNKPNEYGKKPFDLACSIGNQEFLRTLLERAERLNGVNTLTAPTTGTVDLIDLRRTNSNGLTCLHHACIWGHLDLCKLIVNQNSALGSILIKMKTNNNETPKDIALRYNQIHVVNFLEFAGIPFLSLF